MQCRLAAIRLSTEYLFTLVVGPSGTAALNADKTVIPAADRDNEALNRVSP